jgi:hypothetical protein
MTHDWYDIFRHYWWLVFPLFWMVVMVMAQWSRHARANRVLDLVKSYVDQGKEPPAELLKVLQGPFGHGLDTDRNMRRYYRHRHGWVGVLIFIALATWFASMAFGDAFGLPWTHHQMGLVLVAFIFMALALGRLISMASRHRDDDDRALPK